MNIEHANETDIREEIVAPLLVRLGYQRGTENEILREYSISYNRIFLGRKKNNDPPLRGRADYVLAVLGAARWVLEVKSPKEEVSQDVIEQSISYARHPQVSGAYAAVTNGHRFIVFHNSQRSTDRPILDLEVTSLDDLVEKLSGLLTPSAIRRDCSPPVVDLEKPLSDGLRSSAQIRSGVIQYSLFEWRCSFPLPPIATAPLDEMARRMRGFRSNINGGNIRRDERGRVRAVLKWAFPHEELLTFALDKNLMEAEYISLDATISQDQSRPTIFEVIGGLKLKKGERIFDTLSWKSKFAETPLNVEYRGQALGYIDGMKFVGRFQTEYEASPSQIPGLTIAILGEGEFEVDIDNR